MPIPALEQFQAEVAAAEKEAGDKIARRWLRKHLRQARLDPGGESAQIVRSARMRLGEQADEDEVRERSRIRMQRHRERKAKARTKPGRR